MGQTDGGEQCSVPGCHQHHPGGRERPYYRDFGTGRSRGTLTVQLAGNILRGGLVEVAVSGRPCATWSRATAAVPRAAGKVRAIQVGGPLGTYLPESQWDVTLNYGALAEHRTACSDMVVLWCLTTPLTWPGRLALPWSFAPLSPAGSARPAVSGRFRGVEVIDHGSLPITDRDFNLRVCSMTLCDTLDRMAHSVRYGRVDALPRS